MLKGRELHEGYEEQEDRTHWELFQKLPNALSHSSIYGASTTYKDLGWKWVYAEMKKLQTLTLNSLVDSGTQF